MWRILPLLWTPSLIKLLNLSGKKSNVKFRTVEDGEYFIPRVCIWPNFEAIFMQSNASGIALGAVSISVYWWLLLAHYLRVTNLEHSKKESLFHLQTWVPGSVALDRQILAVFRTCLVYAKGAQSGYVLSPLSPPAAINLVVGSWRFPLWSLRNMFPIEGVYIILLRFRHECWRGPTVILPTTRQNSVAVSSSWQPVRGDTYSVGSLRKS
jgi:hypothetical protein